MVKPMLNKTVSTFTMAWVTNNPELFDEALAKIIDLRVRQGGHRLRLEWGKSRTDIAPHTLHIITWNPEETNGELEL